MIVITAAPAVTITVVGPVVRTAVITALMVVFVFFKFFAPGQKQDRGDANDETQNFHTLLRFSVRNLGSDLAGGYRVKPWPSKNACGSLRGPITFDQ